MNYACRPRRPKGWSGHNSPKVTHEITSLSSLWRRLNLEKPLKKKTYEIPDCWTQEPFHHKKKQIEKDDWQDTDGPNVPKSCLSTPGCYQRLDCVFLCLAVRD